MARRVAAALGAPALIILGTGEAANALSAGQGPLAEPSFMMLLGTGLVAIVGFPRRHRRERSSREPHDVWEGMDPMNRTLLVCRSCLRIRGCSDPIAKWCGACTTHDCPTLPARQSTVATCEACAVKSAPTVLTSSGAAAPRAEAAPAWLA